MASLVLFLWRPELRVFWTIVWVFEFRWVYINDNFALLCQRWSICAFFGTLISEAGIVQHLCLLPWGVYISQSLKCPKSQIHFHTWSPQQGILDWSSMGCPSLELYSRDKRSLSGLGCIFHNRSSSSWWYYMDLQDLQSPWVTVCS